YQPRVVTQRQLLLAPLLERRQPELFDPGDRGGCEGLGREVGQRRASPAAVSLAESAGDGRVIAGSARALRVEEQTFEAMQIDLLRVGAKLISRPVGQE